MTFDDIRKTWERMDRVQKGAVIGVGALGFTALFVSLGRSNYDGHTGNPRTGTYKQLWNTYYITTSETDFPRGSESPLYTQSGELIANVSHRFAQDLFVEGAGFIADGRLLNVASSSCGRGDYFTVTSSIHGQQCYHLVDRSRAPWGYGVQGRPLVALHTIATDRNVIPWGSHVYIAQFDGLVIPKVDTVAGPIGGFVHNGCFLAGDTGGAITGTHIDIFAGSRAMMRILERVYPTRSRLDAWVNTRGCG